MQLALLMRRDARTRRQSPGLALQGSLLAAAICALVPRPAIAQSQDTASIGPALPAIVVTGTRREESEIEAAVAVTVLSGAYLREHQIRSIEDMSATVPGLVTSNNVNYGVAPLSIRGVGGINGGGNFFGDDPVAVYLDEVYLGRTMPNSAALLDIASIEVLRGPQGSLYGRNATGGAILMRSVRPGAGGDTYLRAGVGSFGEHRAAAALEASLARGSLDARFAASYSDKPGYGINTFDGSRMGGAEDLALRGSIRFAPGMRLTWDLVADLAEQTATPATIGVADLSNPATASPFVPRKDLETVLDQRLFAADAPNHFESRQRGVTALGKWRGDAFELRSVTALRTYSYDGRQDSDGTARSLFTNAGNGDIEQFSQELRLSSPGSARLDTVFWSLGAYYLHEDSAFDFFVQNLRGFYGLGTDAAFRGKQKTDALALFGEVTVPLARGLSVTAGGRYSHERKRFANANAVDTLNGGTLPTTGAELPAGAVLVPERSRVDKARFDDFSPQVVVEAYPLPGLLTYASYARGFTSGGFNVFEQVDAYRPQTVKAWELGAKASLFDRRLTLALAAFRYAYKDMQVRLPVPTGGVSIVNATASRIEGIELETRARPIAALDVRASVAALDARFTRGVIPRVPLDARFGIGAPIPLEPADLTGNRLSRSPRWQIALGADYEARVSPGATLRLNASWRYQSKVFFLETNQAASTFRGRAFAETDLSAALAIDRLGITLSAFGKNVFDNRHFTQVTPLGAFPNAAINEPARWGLEVATTF